MGSVELFPDIPQDPRPKRLPFPLFQGRFLRVRVAYEDMILGALGLILLLLGGFCLGVERGKGLVSYVPNLETGAGLSSTVAHAAARAGTEPPAPAGSLRDGPGGSAASVFPVIPPAVSPPPQETISGSGSAQGVYAIQLATYVGGVESAQEEARRLARQGRSVLVVRQGKYFELRAVGFRSWNEAQEALTGLRKTYRDAFIKRLASSGG